MVAKSGVCLHATRSGTVCGHALLHGEKMQYNITRVLYVPNLQANLFSVSRAVDMRLKVVFENNVCKLIRRGKEVAVAVREHQLFELKMILNCDKNTDLKSTMEKTPSAKQSKKKTVTFQGKTNSAGGDSLYKKSFQIL